MALVNGGLFALYGHKEILVNSSLKATKKIAMVLSKIQVGDPGLSWPACLFFQGQSLSIDRRKFVIYFRLGLD